MIRSILLFPALASAALVQYVLGSARERHFGQWSFRLEYRNFFLGLPTLIALLIVVVLTALHLLHVDDVESFYLRQAEAAVKEQRRDEAVVCLERLIRFRPADQNLRLSLVAAYEARGDADRAAALLKQLAPVDNAGFRKAQLWMVRRALQHSERLSEDEFRDVEARLIRMRGHGDVEPGASEILADLYLATDRPEFVLRDPQLNAAAQRLPSLKLQLILAARDENTPEATADAAAKLLPEFRKQLTTAPDDVVARRSLVQALSLAGDLKAALVIIREGLTIAPQDDTLKNMAAGLLHAQAQSLARQSTDSRRLEEFAREANRVLQTYEPLGEVATLQLAQVLRLAGDRVGAVRLFRRVAAEMPEARLDLAIVLHEMNRPEEANREFQTVRTEFESADPAIHADPQRRTVAGVAAARLEDFAAATELLEPAAATLPPARRALVESYIAWSDSQPEDAAARRMDLLRKALQLEPFEPQAFSRLIGLLQADAKTAATAREFLGELIGRGDAPAAAYLMLGTDAAARNDQEAALKYLDQANRLAPGAPVILNNLAWTLAAGDDEAEWQRALLLSNVAVLKEPSNLRFRETRGRIYAKLRIWREALDDLEACAKAFDADPQYHALIADIYQRLGLTEPAESHRRRLAELQKQSGNGESAK